MQWMRAIQDEEFSDVYHSEIQTRIFRQITGSQIYPPFSFWTIMHYYYQTFSQFYFTARWCRKDFGKKHPAVAEWMSSGLSAFHSTASKTAGHGSRQFCRCTDFIILMMSKVPMVFLNHLEIKWRKSGYWYQWQTIVEKDGQVSTHQNFSQ